MYNRTNLTPRRMVRALTILVLTLTILMLAACAAQTPASTPPATEPEQTLPPATPIPQQEQPTREILDPPGEDSATPPAGGFDPATTTVALQPLLSGLNQPLFVTAAGDGSDRLFVVEKPGRIIVYGPDRSEGETFLDLTDRVGSGGSEQGLLGLAFAPNFAETGHFFVNYTDRNGDTVIARYELSADDPTRGDPTREVEILKLAQPAPNHNGGMLAFGPDGHLWIGTGDGGRANDVFGNGQNPQTLLGAMLRIDVITDPTQPYTIPGDNPWIEADYQGQTVADEIWAIGLRNPWRYSFDRATGDLWIADVGQNRYEEVNLIAAAELYQGYNFGWPIMEGNQCFQSGSCDPTGLTLPILDYDHSQGCSITGGAVYRGSAYPLLDGAYFYADYCSGNLWGTWIDTTGDRRNELLTSTGQRISSFGEDEAGEIYVTDLSGGTVSRLIVSE